MFVSSACMEAHTHTCSHQGFFQPLWEGALGPLALGNFQHFNRNWENFFYHFYMIFLNRDPKTALNHSYSWLYALLAHLSRRLIGELIVYPWSGVRRPSASVVRRRRRPSSTMLKHLLLRNRSADQSQILCGASLGRGNEILFAASGSHDQDGRHAHIW